jgi:cell wall assembly regulator SMI1
MAGVEAVEANDMMADLIQQMDLWLKTNRPDYYARLQTGVLDGWLDEFETRFGLTLPAEFRELYNWRNGQEPTCSASLQRNLMFSSLEDVAASKDLLDGMIDTDFEDPRWWRRQWVPFLSNGGGDHLCLDLAALDGGTPGQLITFYHDNARRPIRFPGVAAWLKDLVQSMENGTLKVV